MKRGMKKAVIISLTATMAFATSKFAFANTQALPNGTIINQDGINYLTDSSGKKYSGWFIDSKEDWYYFNELDKSMKTGWHHDENDGYWYYLNFSDGKMVTGWQTIDGKEYFFQPVRDMGNYSFSNEQEKWLYSINSKVPYGAMYVNTTTPDGLKVDNQGVKIIDEKISTDNDTKTSDILKNGWVSENGKWYYYNAGATIKDQWLNLNGKWYYVTNDGSMVCNSWKDIGGNSYYFGSDGAMYVNTTTPDGAKVDGNGIKIVNTNMANLNDFIGGYDIEGATGAGTNILITAISDNHICGAFYNMGTGRGTHANSAIGLYSEFQVPLLNNKFTINGYKVELESEIDGEITGWFGQTGTFESEYCLTYIDGEPAIIDNDYHEFGIYYGKAGWVQDNFWESFSIVNGDYWN